MLWNWITFFRQPVWIALSVATFLTLLPKAGPSLLDEVHRRPSSSSGQSIAFDSRYLCHENPEQYVRSRRKIPSVEACFRQVRESEATACTNCQGASSGATASRSQSVAAASQEILQRANAATVAVDVPSADPFFVEALMEAVQQRADECIEVSTKLGYSKGTLSCVAFSSADHAYMSKGWCARAVRLALESAGFHLPGRPYAYQQRAQLARLGRSLGAYNPNRPPPDGSIIVCDGGPTGRGHIEVATKRRGDGARIYCSDHCSRDDKPVCMSDGFRRAQVFSVSP